MDNNTMDKLWIISVIGVFGGIALLLVGKYTGGESSDLFTRIGGVVELVSIPFMTFFTMRKGKRK